MKIFFVEDSFGVYLFQVLRKKFKKRKNDAKSAERIFVEQYFYFKSMLILIVHAVGYKLQPTRAYEFVWLIRI